jgi:predicted HTH transcriptional regulator
LDELRDVERRIAARLAELRPMVEEYEELQRMAERLGVETAPRQSKAAPARRARRAAAKPKSSRRAARTKSPARGSSSRRRAGGTQATGRERRERVLALIREQPGITVPDISALVGVDAPSLYRVVRKLQSEGVVKKEGKQLQLAG